MQNISDSEQAQAAQLSEDNDGWETSSTVSTVSIASTPDTQETFAPAHSRPKAATATAKPKAHTALPAALAPTPLASPLDQYWIERAKFIKHLEKRSKKFAKRSKEDYDAARWGKHKARPVKKAAPTSTKSATKTASPVPPRPAQATPASPPPYSAIPPASSSSDSKSGMIASTSKGVARVARVAQVAQVAKPAMASFSTSAPAFKSKTKKDPNAMDVLEAARVLRALEITKPSAAYALHLQLKLGKNNKAPSIRGRVTLARDPRRLNDVILVFAEPNSKSAQLAREAGVAYVGATELIDALLANEIHPTKVLTTPGMLPTVTGRLARFLGPKGLMPTARRGGVGEGEELVERIKEARGAMDWKTDDNGRVRSPVGRVSFSLADVETNIKLVVKSVRDGMTTTSNNALDEHLVSKRAAQAKQSAGITAAYLESSSGPRITLRDY